ncbi:MAG: NADH-quinone oxidoreductase subunit H [Catenulispora sp.]|nr:NADH-quinone oxidoreductase subunit H [Catenulispora sp.]
MGDPILVTVSGGWAIPGAVILAFLATAAASFDAALTARAEGVAARSALLAPVREVARLLRQSRRTTVAADKLLWRAGTSGLVAIALLMIAVVPLGRWTLADLSVGVVWFNALDVFVWALVWLTGWGPNSAYALVGGYRFLAQALAYELPLMFALIAPAVGARSLRVGDIVAAQDGLWFVVWMPIAFVVYCGGVAGFAVWGPFSPALSSDLAGGVEAELSGVDRLLFVGGRYAVLAAGTAFAIPLFLGGGAGPLLPAWIWTVVKTVVLLGVMVWLGHKLPIARPDRFLEAAWVIVLPLALAQDLLVALVAVWRT